MMCVILRDDFSEFSYPIAAVAVGWQVYALTSSASALGMVGLMQFIPRRPSSSSPGMPPTATTENGWFRSARSERR
jgi:hypothetical protein